MSVKQTMEVVTLMPTVLTPRAVTSVSVTRVSLAMVLPAHVSQLKNVYISDL